MIFLDKLSVSNKIKIIRISRLHGLSYVLLAKSELFCLSNQLCHKNTARPWKIPGRQLYFTRFVATTSRNFEQESCIAVYLVQKCLIQTLTQQGVDL